ncbi:MAG: hypothetical protein A2445_02120 [Candidatus Jacksonbacteria bacterium RIFOXYC2_FULL_44_29]|nr:MAG: hypothetical protein UW45_C0027G0005 [Parcubacteria group bacterium GW2011_GWC2_44_22]OGY77847.1 MAG: hypothetical protein A2295_05510 [Candidatus Jacksonbacteria bacterium RIFOXYB2_FULL_44_15]OGY78380.1 MAG: hypothetical protein A2550_06480 [Candidatus Jacksonbacteria bacterium RIFOXYD2_FULL_43_21]OGY81086.1 MAG: hypothetical protein A2445_02120 [Candidatus Jacksonbacteria bacterium RIFOXYC2_FULL_44_29]HBH46577.1 hypothetical protein [Candidatus Jacksonbacteria bacterium]
MKRVKQVFIGCVILLAILFFDAFIFLGPVIEENTDIKLLSAIPNIFQVKIVRADAQVIPDETIPAPDLQKVGRMLTLLHEFNLSFNHELALNWHSQKWWEREVVSSAIFQVMDAQYLTLNECEKEVLVKLITSGQMPGKVYLNGKDLEVDMSYDKADDFETFMVMSYRDTGYLARYAVANKSRGIKLKVLTEQTFQDLIKKGLLTKEDKPTHTLLE